MTTSATKNGLFRIKALVIALCIMFAISMAGQWVYQQYIIKQQQAAEQQNLSHVFSNVDRKATDIVQRWTNDTVQAVNAQQAPLLASSYNTYNVVDSTSLYLNTSLSPFEITQLVAIFDTKKHIDRTLVVRNNTTFLSIAAKAPNSNALIAQYDLNALANTLIESAGKTYKIGLKTDFSTILNTPVDASVAVLDQPLSSLPDLHVQLQPTLESTATASPLLKFAPWGLGLLGALLAYLILSARFKAKLQAQHHSEFEPIGSHTYVQLNTVDTHDFSHNTSSAAHSSEYVLPKRNVDQLTQTLVVDAENLSPQKTEVFMKAAALDALLEEEKQAIEHTEKTMHVSNANTAASTLLSSTALTQHDVELVVDKPKHSGLTKAVTDVNAFNLLSSDDYHQSSSKQNLEAIADELKQGIVHTPPAPTLEFSLHTPPSATTDTTAPTENVFKTSLSLTPKDETVEIGGVVSAPTPPLNPSLSLEPSAPIYRAQKLDDDPLWGDTVNFDQSLTQTSQPTKSQTIAAAHEERFSALNSKLFDETALKKDVEKTPAPAVSSLSFEQQLSTQLPQAEALELSVDELNHLMDEDEDDPMLGISTVGVTTTAENATVIQRNEIHVTARALSFEQQDLFRAYDLRGEAELFTPAFVVDIGRALGSAMVEQQAQQCVVGHDTRTSSKDIQQHVIEGLQAAGIQVINIGLCPTPALHFASQTYGKHWVMVTASHNPSGHNGIKWAIAGKPPAPQDIQALRQRIEQNTYTEGQAKPVTEDDFNTAYAQSLTDMLSLNNIKRVCVDGFDGSMGPVAHMALTRLGLDVIARGLDQTGAFVEGAPDPSQEDRLHKLRESVTATQADIGIAFDGDGDRLVVIDNQGRTVSPDHLMMLFSRIALQDQPGGDVFIDVKSSRAVHKEISRLGGVPHFVASGNTLVKHAVIKAAMAAMGAEYSGHYVLHHELGYFVDDALLAAIKLILLIDQQNQPLSALVDALPVRFATPDIYIAAPPAEIKQLIETLTDKLKLQSAIRLLTIDGLRADYAEGFALVRASNTSHSITFRIDADSAEALSTISKHFIALIHQIHPEIGHKLLETIVKLKP